MAMNVREIGEGISALLENAENLICEANYLQVGGFHARAFTLAHLAREELSKVQMLDVAAIKIQSGLPVDWKTMNRALVSHTAKLKNEIADQIVLIKGSVNPSLSSDEAGGYIDIVSEYRNDRKNASLYVSFKDGKWLLPSSQFSEKQASECIRLAEISLIEQRGNFQLHAPYDTRPPLTSEQLRLLNELIQKSPEQIFEIASHLQALLALKRGDEGALGS